jgi:hypothetical protein
VALGSVHDRNVESGMLVSITRAGSFRSRGQFGVGLGDRVNMFVGAAEEADEKIEDLA